MIEIGRLRERLVASRGRHAQEVHEDDIERAIKKLQLLGNGFKVMRMGGRKMVVSVPVELNRDHEDLGTLGQTNGGCVSPELAKEHLGWDSDRFHRAIMVLMREGMVWIDDGDESASRLYWFPSLCT